MINTRVQVMLDDHILKAQTMHSSAYIKPFEEEMKEWEDKLISMQVDRGHLSVQQCDISVILRIFWMPGWGARSPGCTSSPSSTARTSWSRCQWRGGSSTRLTASGGTSWPRQCQIQEYYRPLASQTCWWDSVQILHNQVGSKALMKFQILKSFDWVGATVIYKLFSLFFR